jgi:predicted DCC family thiol-disulfide oxidoreductase YuxK
MATRDPARSEEIARERLMPTLLFDGACGFCTAAVYWIDTRLERRTRLVPWQEAPLADYGLAPEEARRTVWWIEPSGERFHSEQAVARALGSCAPRWQRLGRLLRAPGIRRLARTGYRLVARFRHRLPGTTPACEAPGWRVGSPSRGPG